MSMTLAVMVHPYRTRRRLRSSPRPRGAGLPGHRSGLGLRRRPPEGFGDHICDVLAVDGYRVISTSEEEMRWKAERLGLEVEHMPYMQQP